IAVPADPACGRPCGQSALAERNTANSGGFARTSSSRPPAASARSRASESPSPLPDDDTERSKMCGAIAAGTPSPSSATSMTTDGPARHAAISTVPRPYISEFSSNVVRIWASAVGVARTPSPRSPLTWMLRRAPANAGCHSRCSEASTESSETAGLVSVPLRVRLIRSSTPRLSRSTWSIAMFASSSTTSRSSVLAISSRRMRSAVSGVRSWCEASAAKSRSEASRLAPCWAPRARAASSRSTSSMPERSGTGRGSPGPSRSARSPRVARKWARRVARRSAIQAATPMAMAPAMTTAPARAASTTGVGGVPSKSRSTSGASDFSGSPGQSSSAATATPTSTAVMTTACATVTTRSRRTCRSVLRGVEAEADPTDGGDVARVRRVVAQLPAQDRDVHVERLGRAVPGAVPHVAHQLLARDDLALVGHEHLEQLELLAGELHLLAMEEDATPLGVDPHQGLGGRRLDDASAQQRTSPGEQLGEPERLRDVVVGTGIEPHDRVDLVGAGGQHEHGNGAALLTQPPAHLEAVHLRQAEVEHQQVGRAQGLLERGDAVGADVDVVALAPQRAGQRVGDRGVVLREQHLGHGAIVVTRSRRSAQGDGLRVRVAARGA